MTITGHTDSLFYIHISDNGFDLISPGIFGFTKPMPIPFSRLKAVKTLTHGQLYYLDPLLFSNDIIDRYGFDHISFEQQDSLYFRVEYLSEKRVPVRVPLRIEWAPQTQLAQPISVQPDSVTIYGSYSQVDSIDSIASSPQHFVALQHSTEQSVPLQIPSGIRCSHHTATLKIATEAFTETSLQIPIQTPWDSSGHVRVFPKKAEVHFSVSLSRYKAIKANQFQLYASIDSNSQGQLFLHIQRHPTGVRILNIEPNIAEYIFIK